MLNSENNERLSPFGEASAGTTTLTSTALVFASALGKAGGAAAGATATRGAGGAAGAAGTAATAATAAPAEATAAPAAGGEAAAKAVSLGPDKQQ